MSIAKSVDNGEPRRAADVDETYEILQNEYNQNDWKLVTKLTIILEFLTWPNKLMLRPRSAWSDDGTYMNRLYGC